MVHFIKFLCMAYQMGKKTLVIPQNLLYPFYYTPSSPLYKKQTTKLIHQDQQR